MSVRRRIAASRPALLIELPLEGLPQLRIRAATLEDERRLRVWLRRARGARLIDEALRELLEVLEETA